MSEQVLYAYKVPGVIIRSEKGPTLQYKKIEYYEVDDIDAYERAPEFDIVAGLGDVRGDSDV